MVVPGKLIEIDPPHAQMHCEELFSAGLLAIKTVGEPGVHGAGMTGTQGMGVSTPSAAAVAAATVGFAKDWHMPKGMMLTIGMLSMMVAAGLFSIITMAWGITIRVLGATPKLHIIVPVATTGRPMCAS